MRPSKEPGEEDGGDAGEKDPVEGAGPADRRDRRAKPAHRAKTMRFWELGTMFLVAFAIGWLVVAGTTVAHFLRPREERGDISLLARAGLLICFTGILAAMFAAWWHWPPSQISEMYIIGMKCKVTGFALLFAGLIGQGLASRRPVARQPGSRPAAGQPVLI